MEGNITRTKSWLANYTQPQYLLGVTGVVALIATAGSLYFSEVWGLAPCKLCWLQRIFMYPLVLLVPVALRRKDKKAHEYILPLTLVGTMIALYHTIIYYMANYSYGTNETILFACTGGVSCTNIQVEWFGFITIPLLSLMAFLIIDGLMWGYKNRLKTN